MLKSSYWKWHIDLSTYGVTFLVKTANKLREKSINLIFVGREGKKRMRDDLIPQTIVYGCTTVQKAFFMSACVSVCMSATRFKDYH